MSDATVVIANLPADPDRLERCAAILDASEIARAGRFLRAADRGRFMASHAALRLVLGEVLERPPQALTFGQDTSGRPFLRDGGDLDFNLSHSGDLALVGLVRGAKIGIDVEARRPIPDVLRIAQGHFAPDEIAALAALPPEPRAEAFFGLWTRKEAVVKALGAGLSLPLATFSVTVPPAPPRLLRMAGGTEHWTLAQIDADREASATVAVLAAGVTIRVRRLPEDWTGRLRAK